jgi:myo-inositol 2-dehydrogenase / D-chiro-inositol 1-dehydrogenase
MVNRTHRRDFLLGSAVTLGSMGLSAAQAREIRVAMIGVGNRGSSLLKLALAQRQVKIAAICDVDAQARDQAQGLAARDNPHSYTDYRQVLDLSEVDAVIVATPCNLHAEMAVAALAAGKHIYCEKPLGVNPEQVSNALTAARKSDKIFQIGQQLRYYPQAQEVIAKIHQERIAGDLFAIKAQRHGTPRAPGNVRERPAWYLDVKQSGDLIVENSVHNLDMCNWIAGSHPVSACGHGKTYLPEQTPAGERMMDGFSVQYVYESGINVDYTQYYFHPRGLKTLRNGQWYEIFGQKGAVEFTHTNGRFYPMQGGETVPIVKPESLEAKEDAMGDFMACIRENRKPLASIEVAATAALTAIMGREAIYQRRMVSWKELGVDV